MSLDPLEHARIFWERIAPNVFAGAVPAAAPTIVVMGGQPGSGKSGLLDAARRELSGAGAPAVQIVGDDLRDYHPAYRGMLRADDRSAAALTDADTGRWVEMCLEHARRLRCSVVVEGTMRRPEVPVATARAFGAAGYRVEAWVMAVDPVSSRLGILARYHAQRAAHGAGRFTVDAAHDAAVAGMLDSLDWVQDAGVVGRFLLLRRGPEVVADVPGAAREPRLRQVVEQERCRSWTAGELASFRAVAADVAALLPAGHGHRRVLEDLGRQAQARAAAPDPGRASFPVPLSPGRGHTPPGSPAPGVRPGLPGRPGLERD